MDFSNSGSPLTEQMLTASQTAFILREAGPDVAYFKKKITIHVDPVLQVTGFRGI